jgi:hypothetical protein
MDRFRKAPLRMTPAVDFVYRETAVLINAITEALKGSARPPAQLMRL